MLMVLRLAATRRVHVAATFERRLFIGLNFLLLKIGLLAFGFGLWGVVTIQREKKGFDERISSRIDRIEDRIEERVVDEEEDVAMRYYRGMKAAVACLAAAGAILVGAAFLGFCGGKNRYALGIFSAILLAPTILFLAALVVFHGVANANPDPADWPRVLKICQHQIKFDIIVGFFIVVCVVQTILGSIVFCKNESQPPPYATMVEGGEGGGGKGSVGEGGGGHTIAALSFDDRRGKDLAEPSPLNFGTGLSITK